MKKWFTYLLIFMFTTPFLIASSCETATKSDPDGSGNDTAPDGRPSEKLDFKAITEAEGKLLYNFSNWALTNDVIGASISSKINYLKFEANDGNNQQDHTALALYKSVEAGNNITQILTGRKVGTVGTVDAASKPAKYKVDPKMGDNPIILSKAILEASPVSASPDVWMYAKEGDYTYFVLKNTDNTTVTYKTAFGFNFKDSDTEVNATSDITSLKVAVLDANYALNPKASSDPSADPTAAKQGFDNLTTGYFKAAELKKVHNEITPLNVTLSFTNTGEDVSKVLGIKRSNGSAGTSRGAISHTAKATGNKIAFSALFLTVADGLGTTQTIGFGETLTDADTMLAGGAPINLNNIVNIGNGFTLKKANAGDAEITVTLYAVPIGTKYIFYAAKSATWNTTGGATQVNGKIYFPKGMDYQADGYDLNDLIPFIEIGNKVLLNFEEANLETNP